MFHIKIKLCAEFKSLIDIDATEKMRYFQIKNEFYQYHYM